MEIAVPAPAARPTGGPGFGRLAKARERSLNDWHNFQCRSIAFGWSADCPGFAQPSKSEALERERREVSASKQDAAEEARLGRDRVHERCRRERQRSTPAWQPIGLNFFSSRPHERRAPGMLYGLEFPWNEDLLVEFGPAWLTKAFHAAGSIAEDNRVIAIIPERSVKVTAGNNAGKFLFEVRYAKQTADLHTQLFAKIPFPLAGTTANDRKSSSVYKQPMDFHEINTYRLLESELPVKVPKFYYGDISNETSNYILITERVPFAELRGRKSGQLQPLDVEGPYEKCKDWMLRGPEREYYMLLVRKHAEIAAAHKAGKMGDVVSLQSSLKFAPTSKDNYHINPDAATGERAADCLRRLEVAIEFFGSTAKNIFPSYVTNGEFQAKFRSVMLKLNAYAGEVQYWKHRDPDYVAFGHQNLNMDNAYFWREENGELSCGIFDFGGFGSSSLPHRLWWGLNCAEFDQISANLNDYIVAFCNAYKELGGPQLDAGVMRMAIVITALENLMFMVRAVPDCLEQCPEEEWATISNRRDPRVAGDIGGKSTLRTTLQVMTNGLRMIQEMEGDKVLDSWVSSVYSTFAGHAHKAVSVINP